MPKSFVYFPLHVKRFKSPCAFKELCTHACYIHTEGLDFGAVHFKCNYILGKCSAFMATGVSPPVTCKTMVCVAMPFITLIDYVEMVPISPQTKRLKSPECCSSKFIQICLYKWFFTRQYSQSIYVKYTAIATYGNCKHQFSILFFRPKLVPMLTVIFGQNKMQSCELQRLQKLDALL